MTVESRGVEWNIFIYRILNEFIFSSLIGKIDPPTKMPFDKDFNKIQKKQLFRIIMFGLILIAANIGAFKHLKKQSLFEQMQIPRVCTESQIEKAFQDAERAIQQTNKGILGKQVQIKEKELNEMKDILKNPARRIIYDKYGITDVKYASYLTSTYTMHQILQTGVSYLVLLLVSIAGSGQQQKSIIKWQVLLIINFFIMEIHLLQCDSLKADFIDQLFPYLTIQHRLIIIKFLLVPAQIIVGYISSKLTPNKVRHLQSKVLFLKDGIYSQIQQLSLQQENNPNVSDEQKQHYKLLNQTASDHAQLLKDTNDIISLKNKQNESKWDIGSLIKFLLIGYIVYQQIE
ncbi:DnaJ domain protein (macronuclear) [Tetrahymena thermophila SB210]|uniref:DnaJ domain protein n=1 Tax=Tetrahymena thermophila (strain SB210) TaxID=312017 RepID=Q248B9_TETTS|nr:DnaJ domain protein [Tetrahymena thermophila SB210]EAS04126.2 DnaJ domain protein [Tetrahymena thermophila SB210]|eukprot:XP_001024371.2 DnaJ domain protein [Tetrahymena thermophila SB210]